MDKLSLAVGTITAAKTAHGIVEIPELKNMWIERYQATQNKGDGEMRFENEKLHFLKAFQANPKLDNLDPFSKYAAFFDLSNSGLSLADDHGYIMSMDNKTVIFFPSWHGRLEQIRLMPQVKYAYDPEVVYDCDHYKMERKGPIKTIEHEEEKLGPRTKQSKITHVYMFIEYTDGRIIPYEMKALDVYNIRDIRSKTFIQYANALKLPINQGKKIGDKVTFQGRDSSWEIDPPMSVTDEAQYFKKTLVRRVYKSIPKTAKQRELDAKIEEHLHNMAPDPISKMPDNEVDEFDTNIKSENIETEEFTEFEVVGEEKVDISTGEVQNNIPSSDDDEETY